MTPRSTLLTRTGTLALALAAALAGAAASSEAFAQTPDAALLTCARNTDSAARLACFDGLATQARQRQVAGGPSAAAATAAATAPVTPKPDEFGRPPRVDDSGLGLLESRIAGRFEGWSANQRIPLVNGQVWQIADDSSGFGNAQEPVVRIRRGALGSYRMEVEGVVRSPRVKRVK